MPRSIANSSSYVASKLARSVLNPRCMVSRRRSTVAFAVLLLTATSLGPTSRAQAISGAADSVRSDDRLESMPSRPSPGPPGAGARADLSLDLDRFAEHPRVASYIRYFQGQGRETLTRWLNRGAPYLPMIRSRLG